jgi:hypothetical protein
LDTKLYGLQGRSESPGRKSLATPCNKTTVPLASSPQLVAISTEKSWLHRRPSAILHDSAILLLMSQDSLVMAAGHSYNCLGTDRPENAASLLRVPGDGPQQRLSFPLLFTQLLFDPGPTYHNIPHSVRSAYAPFGRKFVHSGKLVKNNSLRS